MQIVIDISEEEYKCVQITGCIGNKTCISNAIYDGTPLPKGHGRLVDAGKIDEDRIESDNPIIYLTINGEYTEAVSLDYINNLPTIIEADGGDENECHY